MRTTLLLSIWMNKLKSIAKSIKIWKIKWRSPKTKKIRRICVRNQKIQDLCQTGSNRMTFNQRIRASKASPLLMIMKTLLSSWKGIATIWASNFKICIKDWEIWTRKSTRWKGRTKSSKERTETEKRSLAWLKNRLSPSPLIMNSASVGDIWY